MYHDLKKIYSWNGMKSDVANFVANYKGCQKVRVEHMRPGRLYQEVDLPE